MGQPKSHLKCRFIFSLFNNSTTTIFLFSSLVSWEDLLSPIESGTLVFTTTLFKDITIFAFLSTWSIFLAIYVYGIIKQIITQHLCSKMSVVRVLGFKWEKNQTWPKWVSLRNFGNFRSGFILCFNQALARPRQCLHAITSTRAASWWWPCLLARPSR